MLTRLSNIFISTRKTNATVESKVMSVMLTTRDQRDEWSSETRILYE